MSSELPDLPAGWCWSTLEQLGDWCSGGTPSRTREDFYGGQLPWLKTGELTDSDIWIAEEHITQAGLDSSSAKILPVGSILIAMYGATIGQTGRLCIPAATNQACAALIPNKQNRSALPFVWRYLISQRSAFRHAGKGGAQPNISQSILRVWPIPMAPILEQHRIVESIDSYLSRLDAAEASLERVQTKLKAYRASVLKAAVEGRLVPTEAEIARREGRDYEPASVLLARILKERRRRWEEAELARMKKAGKTPKDDAWKKKYEEPEAPDTSKLPALPEGWCWASVEQLLVAPLANGKSVPDGMGLPVLRLTAIRNGCVDLTERKLGQWGSVDPSPFLVNRDDFLIVRGNGSLHLVGRGGRVSETAERVAFPDTLIRAHLAGVQPALLPHLWDSPPIRGHIEKRARTTAGIYKVNQTDLEQTPIPLAPMAEQDRLAAEIERLTSVSSVSLAAVSLEIGRVGRLRQSVLKWAFEGKLVDQDPSDEPAEELLARIRAERAATPTTKTRGRKAKSS